MTTETSQIGAAADDQPGKKERPSFNPLFSLAPYALKHKWAVIGTIIALLGSTGAMLTLPVGIRRMIDFGFSGADGLIHKYFAFMILIGLVLAIASSSRYFFVNWLGERVIADLRRDVFANLARLSPAFYEKEHSGEVMSRLTADTTQIKTAVGIAASQTLRNLVMLIGALLMMFITSPTLSLLLLVAIPVIILPLMAYGRFVRSLSRKAQDSLADASAFASENLSAVRTMQAFTNEKPVISRFATAVELSFSTAVDRMKARTGLTAITIFLAFASVVGILWYGAAEVVAGNMTGGRLSQFVLYSVLAAGAIAELGEVWNELQQAAGSAERLTELLAQKSEIVSPENPAALPSPVVGQIDFEDVTFAYPTRPETNALAELNLSIKPGETVALVGPSGAGKSTLFSLLLRFYDPTRGTVRVDGVPVNTADVSELRDVMSLVPQDVALFADTVTQNIGYGKPGASEAEIKAAAKAAAADEFIDALPNGYDTQLGERGTTLSGGQRQRIAIARAILRDAPILLLDEATSALDTENEHLIQKALATVMEGRTTLVVAHRLATVQSADRIIVLEDGRIVEQGTHAELIDRNGAYAALARLQFPSVAAE